MSFAAHWMGYLLAGVAMGHALGFDRRLFGRLVGQNGRTRPHYEDQTAAPSEPAANEHFWRSPHESNPVAAPFAWGERGRPKKEHADDQAWPSRWM